MMASISSSDMFANAVIGILFHLLKTSLAYLSPLAINAAEFLTHLCNHSLLGTRLSTPFSAGPVASFNGLWQEAQLDWNNALPSGAANEEKWLKNSVIISIMEALAIFRYISFLNSDTGINN